MSTRISQRNGDGGNVMLEFKPLKTFGKTLSSSCMFSVVNFHMSSRCSQNPPDPRPLTSSTWKDEAPRSTSVPPVSSAAAICLVWETSNSSHTFALPLWDRMSQMTQPRSSAQGVGAVVLHRICREKENGSGLEQPWLNNCVNITQVRMFFEVKMALHSQCWFVCVEETPKTLGYPFIPPPPASFFFFSSSSSPSSFSSILFKTEIPGSEILPRPINMTFWMSREAEKKPNVITQTLGFHHGVIHQRSWRYCTVLNLNIPSERLFALLLWWRKKEA